MPDFDRVRRLILLGGLRRWNLVSISLPKAIKAAIDRLIRCLCRSGQETEAGELADRRQTSQMTLLLRGSS